MHQEGETVRPVITDTAQWHLNIYLSERKMAAYLRNISEKDIKVYKVLDVKFRSPEDLLSQVESVVYDNPFILDDFSSDIIISTDKFTFLPNEAEECSEDLSEELVTTVFEDEEPSEFFSDKGEKYTCKYFFLKGLKDFFGRTFPGARIFCETDLLLEKFIANQSSDSRIYLNWEDDVVNIFGFKGEGLVFASRVIAESREDVCYYTLNAMSLFDFNAQETQVCVCCENSHKQKLVATLREHIDYVGSAVLPGDVNKYDAPLSVALNFSRFNRG